MNIEQLQRQTIKALRDLAASYDIAERDGLSKAELIDAIVAVSATASTPAPSAAPVPVAGTPEAASAVAATPRSDGPQEADPGLPIPDSYGEDRLVLMVQDPNHLFAYWELTGGALDQAREQLGENGAPVLVLYGDDNTEQRDIDLAGGNYYLAVAPNTAYRADLAIRGSDGRLVVVVASSEVTTPAAGPSERLDEEWMAVDETFSELLSRAGLPGAAGSSADLVASSELQARLWQVTNVTPVSSAELAKELPMGLSSLSLSSHSLGSHTLGSHTLAAPRP